MNAYFDKGMALTKYIKYLLFISGLASDGQQFWTITFIGALYLLSCFVTGYFWYRWKWIEAENEVSNRFNLLAKEIRATIRKNKKI